MLERLFPPFVACAETTRDRHDVELFPEELASLGRPVEKRRREFTTGRACARLALERLGAPVVAIPNGERGEPLWPAGVVGSITHCRGYRGCAVAWSGQVAAIGIDAEPNEPLPDGVFDEIAHGPERELTGAGEAHADRLLFTAKEAVYKAWFPLAGRWLGFEDVELSIRPAAARFSARLLVPGPVVNGVNLHEFHGRWTIANGVICAAVIVLP